MPEVVNDVSEKKVRLYIGNISKQLSENPSLLLKRLEKFGKIESDLELKTKETFENIKYFGYLWIFINDESYKKLLAAFHKVKFMNSDLIIAKAKPSFNEIYNQNFENLLKEEKIQEEKLKETNAKFLTLKTHIDQGLSPNRLHNYFTLIEGGIRKTPRVKNVRHKLNVNEITYRVKFLVFNDKTGKYEKKMKTIRANHKEKLWGFDKHKSSVDLVFKYQNGIWKDGNNHIIERVQTRKLNNDEEILIDDVEKVIEENSKSSKKEIERTRSVLDDFLKNYDFSKHEEFSYEQDKQEKLQSLKEKNDYEADNHYLIHDDDEDEEMMVEDDGIVTNATETLKKVLDKKVEDEGNNGGFTFNLADSDIEDIQEEEEKEEKEEKKIEIKAKVSEDEEVVEERNEPETATAKKALFFAHFDSPFLVAQTQFNKLTAYSILQNDQNEIILNWKKDFQNDRIELMKSFRRRKRDNSRHNNKK